MAEVEELVDLARRGDGDAFDRLYRQYAQSVHAILLARLPAADAEEVLQEVFLNVHRRLADLRDPSAFGPWLHAMARNAAIDAHRRGRRRPAHGPLPEVAGPAGPDGELRERVLEHIQALPEAYRETLLMRLVEGLTGPEISRLTGLAPGSVRVNLHRGMEMLRERLRKDGWP
jgi:RNA polymerase sigma-70 factor (ECF subfamily)